MASSGTPSRTAAVTAVRNSSAVGGRPTSSHRRATLSRAVTDTGAPSTLTSTGASADANS